MRLVIISHTEHYRGADGTLLGWGPTVTELNHLANDFDNIVHLAMLTSGDAPPSALPYSKKNIQFIAIPKVGGKHFKDKLNIIFNAPKTINIVRRHIKDSDIFQFRAPIGIGVYLIPYLSFFNTKKGWYKYAGNWNQEKAPFGYGLQRFMLKKQKRPVTINGKWTNQPGHCYTFENPCLTSLELEEGNRIRLEKTIGEKIELCYVGRLERQKGVGRILEALKQLSKKDQSRIIRVHLVGDGDERNAFVEIAKKIPVDIIFHGYLSRSEVFKLYKSSHYFLMPTLASEGFPKVLAEASNYGCIPVVTDLSSISQYIIEEKSGYLISKDHLNNFKDLLSKILNENSDSYRNYISNVSQFVNLFSFAHYRKKIKDLTNQF